MENNNVNNNLQLNTPKSSSNYVYVTCICLLFTLLILGRAFTDIFFYVFMAVSTVVFAISSTKHCVPLLLFIMPSATILKTDPDGMSFFTILFFLVIVKMVIFNKRLSFRLILCLLAFFAYSLLVSGIGQITTVITMISGMLMLHYLRNKDIDASLSVITYTFGIAFASILALLRDFLPIISNFISETARDFGEKDLTNRFSGLQGNPNYYTLDIIVALSAIIILMYNNKPHRTHTFCMISLSVFGLMSVSKSFIICWVLLILFWFILSIKQGVGKIVKFLFVGALGIGVIYYVASDYINAYLFRFFQDSSGTLSDITTGRSDIWLAYIKVIFSNAKILLFGNGLNTMLDSVGKGTHNTYLECLFSLGLVGTVIFAVALRVCMGKFRIKTAVWIPVLLLLIRMFAIGILTYDSLWFYLAILLLVSNDCKKNVQEKLKKQDDV